VKMGKWISYFINYSYVTLVCKSLAAGFLFSVDVTRATVYTKLVSKSEDSKHPAAKLNKWVKCPEKPIDKLSL